jgi:hypothetical protein
VLLPTGVSKSTAHALLNERIPAQTKISYQLANIIILIVFVVLIAIFLPFSWLEAGKIEPF